MKKKKKLNWMQKGLILIVIMLLIQIIVSIVVTFI